VNGSEGVRVNAPGTQMRPGAASAKAAWAFVLLGLVAMYLPTYWEAAGSTWQSEDDAHGALMVLIVLWLFWREHTRILESPTVPQHFLGGAVFALGVLFYVYGRALESRTFEFLSPALVVAGILLVLKGRNALAAAWFAIFYILFTIPLPPVLVDTLTGPLKQWISEFVEVVLYAAGYPIARNGVTITIGQYQLLVADACSGLHSMFSLSAIGTLFMYLMKRASRLHNVLMLLAILPIAFAANVVRVIVLVLITYYLGDEAGQGFLHGAAGILLMLVALAGFLVLDHVLAARLGGRGRDRAAAAADPAR